MLALRGLTKRFGRRVAVDDLSLDVERGDIFGFLGPNGAGKTTTIRMIVGLVRPTAGSVVIAGQTLGLWRRDALRQIGAIVEAPTFYDYLSGRDNLRMLADLGGGVEGARIDEVLERVDLRERARDRVGEYSQGMRQRLAIAAALLPKPQLVLLDEPTNGLDPMGIRDVRRLIRGLARDDGLTVLLSSHLLVEVEQLCNRAAILSRGRKLWDGCVADLLERRRRLRLRVSPVETARAVIREAGGEVAPGGEASNRDDGNRDDGNRDDGNRDDGNRDDGDRDDRDRDDRDRDPADLHDAGDPGDGTADGAAVLHVSGLARGPADLVDRLVAAGCRVGELTPELPTLEEVFVELIERRPL